MGRVPALWRELLNEVWGCLQAGGTSSGCPNMMLYLDDVPRVEVGVITDRPCPLEGRVVVSSLPAGRLATTVHRGPYAGLGAAHGAVRSWCRERQLTVVGPRREVYGPHRDDPAEAWTEISYLLA